MAKEVTLAVPLALQQLVRSNNTLLKTYQKQLMDELEEANIQMMRILQLNPDAGWLLDMERMVYTRTVEEESNTDAPVTG